MKGKSNEIVSREARRRINQQRAAGGEARSILDIDQRKKWEGGIQLIGITRICIDRCLIYQLDGLLVLIGNLFAN